MAADPGPVRPSAVPARTPRFSRLVPSAPRPALAIFYLLGLSLLLGALAVEPTALGEGLLDALAIFFVPALAAGLLTGPVASALGGRFSFPRSLLLSTTALALALPFLLLWRAIGLLGTFGALGGLPAAMGVVLVVQGPAMWIRQVGLFGMSQPRHGRTLPAALLQPLIALAALFLLVPPTPAALAGAGVVLLIAFATAFELVRAADRPMRREFGSGVALLRPMLEHISARDPEATRTLEEFFRRTAVEVDLRATMIQFREGDRVVATVALPTVHPGPFAAVGASDLPRKIAESLGPSAGTVFVPHTPCNHELDLPGEEELDRVRSALGELSHHLSPSGRERASGLMAPRPGSLVRAQLLGDSVFAVISRAPEASDDIDYAIIDPFYGREFAGERPAVAFIDAHNSYDRDTGDITYGSVAHRQLAIDLVAAVEGALTAARPGPVRVGAAERLGYSVAQHGIGSQGIRVLAVEAAGTRTAYVLVDANNLLVGLRGQILAGIADRVDAAEVMTTDNHVVHEVDGSVNALGERFPVGELLADIRSTVDRALERLAPATVWSGSARVPQVRVLGPGYSARLLLALRDTISVFRSGAVTSFLLMAISSAALVAVLR